MAKYCPICLKPYRDNQNICPLDGMRLFDREDRMVGKLIDGRFRVMSKISSGGMSAIYRVREDATGVIGAMKILSPRLASDPVQRQRFFRESRVAQRIDHENVVEVWELGETEDGLLFMVMEFLSGETLAERIPSGGMQMARALSIGIQVARGLAHAHDLGVIHRDIKPENVMFTTRGGDGDQVKLLDFGLAWMKGDPRLTATGQVFGTPEYLSPEQAIGDPATVLSDLYALGVLFYEMTTGRTPFEGPATKVMRGHLESTPKAPSGAGGTVPIPAEFDAMVLRLIKKRPSERYQDVHHLLDDFEPVFHGVAQTSGRGGTALIGKEDDAHAADATTLVQQAVARFERIEGLLRQSTETEVPDWFDHALKKLAAMIREAENLERKLRHRADQRMQRERAVRLKRERLGKAVAVVAADESRIRREIEIVRRQVGALDEGLETARIHRKPPSDKILRRLQQSRKDLAGKELRLADLVFQLDQLRGRLGAVSAEFEHDTLKGKGQSRLQSDRIGNLLAEFEPIAWRVEQFFESRQQFSRK